MICKLHTSTSTSSCLGNIKMKVLDAVKDTYLFSHYEFLVVQGIKGFEGLKDTKNIPNEVRSLGDVEIVLDQIVQGLGL